MGCLFALRPIATARRDVAVPVELFPKRDGPAQFLANYAGYLQADAFSGYDGIYKGCHGQILEVACWAHARRKFFDTRSSSPAEASLVLQMIR